MTYNEIDGIDDRLELRLNTLGISTIEQLSKMDKDADEINDAIENMPGRARRRCGANGHSASCSRKLDHPVGVSNAPYF